ncbi:MAG: glutamine synthetase beta-grasp domain-containing protein, partial [Chloroflexi bacterium]|nr:glutamine synthetase beta-grasp domain-containing protein [Chloroflexota bacterium]
MALTSRPTAPGKVTLTSPKDVIEFAQAKGLKFVDFKFVDLPGTWQHFSIPAGELKEDIFSEGIGFDGSSIRGFQKIHESDMLLVPDPKTAIVDPACKIPTLSLICDVRDPITGDPYSRDPRYVAKKAERHLIETGIATVSYWGPEAEFFIFNDVRFDQTTHAAFYAIDSEEGIWNSGQANGGKPNLAYRPRYKEGYFPVPPTDKLQDLRSEIVLRMIEAGIAVEVHHHEVATGGQAEIDIRFDALVSMADKMMLYKYIVKNTCYERGYTATFMPKPLFQD